MLMDSHVTNTINKNSHENIICKSERKEKNMVELIMEGRIVLK
jgi:hypothetical protein